MRHGISPITLLLAAVGLMSGCVSNPILYTKGVPGGYFQIVDLQRDNAESFKGLLVINGRNTCAAGSQKIPLDPENCRRVLDGGHDVVNTVGMNSVSRRGGLNGTVGGDDANVLAYDPAKNLVTGVRRAPYERYEVTANNTEGGAACMEAGDMISAAWSATVADPFLQKMLVTMAKDQAGFASYLKTPTCAAQQQIISAIDAGLVAPILRNTIIRQLARGIDPRPDPAPMSVKQKALAEKAFPGKVKEYTDIPELFWKEVEGKGYCFYAANYINHRLAGLAFEPPKFGADRISKTAMNHMSEEDKIAAVVGRAIKQSAGKDQELLHAYSPSELTAMFSKMGSGWLSGGGISAAGKTTVLHVANEAMPNQNFSRRDKYGIDLVGALMLIERQKEQEGGEK